MKLRDIFWIGVAIWLGGALVAITIGNLLLKEICVNIVGSLTCLLGLFLLIRWIVRKLSDPKADPIVAMSVAPALQPSPAQSPFDGDGMRIYSQNSVPEEARDPIERAIQADAFKPKGRDEDGRELIHVQTPTQDWLALVEVTDAILIIAAYKTDPAGVDQLAKDILSA